jgi:hypothetical protein
MAARCAGDIQAGTGARRPREEPQDTQEAGSGQAERATERLALDPLAALNPSSASAHSKTLTLRSPISQFVQCPCQGPGLMSSRSRGEEAWRPWISRGPLRDASISRAAPGAPRREACTLVHLPRRVVVQSPQGGGGERNVHPRPRRGRSRGTVRGDQSPAETSDPASLIPTHRRRARGPRANGAVAWWPWPLRPGNPVEGGAEFEAAGRSWLLDRRSSTRG